MYWFGWNIMLVQFSNNIVIASTQCCCDVQKYSQMNVATAFERCVGRPNERMTIFLLLWSLFRTRWGNKDTRVTYCLPSSAYFTGQSERLFRWDEDEYKGMKWQCRWWGAMDVGIYWWIGLSLMFMKQYVNINSDTLSDWRDSTSLHEPVAGVLFQWQVRGAEHCRLFCQRSSSITPNM